MTGDSARRRALALTEIETLARQLLQDARMLTAGLEAVLAEVRRATGGES